MSTRARIALFGVGIVTTMALVGAQVRPNIRPKHGYVPNAATAITIAVAVFEPIYGEASVAKHKPYMASPADGVWTVRGTLPPGFARGTAVAEIAKDDGRIVRVFHEQ